MVTTELRPLVAAALHNAECKNCLDTPTHWGDVYLQKADAVIKVFAGWLRDEAGDIEAHHEGEPGNRHRPIVRHLRYLADEAQPAPAEYPQARSVVSQTETGDKLPDDGS